MNFIFDNQDYWTRKIHISLFDKTSKEFILVSSRRDKFSVETSFA